MTAIRAAGVPPPLYPAVLGRALFFELTERRDGYALYGAANAAVRLSAMHTVSDVSKWFVKHNIANTITTFICTYDRKTTMNAYSQNHTAAAQAW